MLIYASQLDIINYSTTFAILILESEKEWKKLQKLEYLKNKNSFLDGIKSIFHSS